MVQKVLALLLLAVFSSAATAWAGETQVKGYTRKDGTVVKGYTRKSKDGEAAKTEAKDAKTEKKEAKAEAKDAKADKSDKKAADEVQVKGYTRKDGKVVKGYTRKKSAK